MSSWSVSSSPIQGTSFGDDAVPVVREVAKALLNRLSSGSPQALLTRVARLAYGCRLNTTTPTVIRYLCGFMSCVTSPEVKAFGGVPSPGQPAHPRGSSPRPRPRMAPWPRRSSRRVPSVHHRGDRKKGLQPPMRVTGRTTFVDQHPAERVLPSLAVIASNLPAVPKPARTVL